MRSIAFLPICSFVALTLVGCDQTPDSFPANELYSVSLAKTRQADPSAETAIDAASVCEQWFGTPANPKWPVDHLSTNAAQTLVQPERLERVAGQVNSDKENVHRGLYREHCVTCHGIGGGGDGPAALFQNPYPRNFRHGVFKWKSTARTSKPTRADLDRLLVNGARGSAMPAFANVPEEDRQALIDYVIYLSVRGEVERGLIAAAIDDLGYGEDDLGPEFRLAAAPGTEGGEVAAEVLHEVARSWLNPDQDSVPVPDSIWAIESESTTDPSSIENGKAIFHGQIANCAGCHGPGGDGSLKTIDYDDWTKEYSTRIGIAPGDRDAFRPMKKLGALPIRIAEPRELRSGVFRGGGDAATLYQRITQGIAGSPMPAVAVVESENGRGLTHQQIGDLIRYVQSLGGTRPAKLSRNPATSPETPPGDQPSEAKP